MNFVVPVRGSLLLTALLLATLACNLTASAPAALPKPTTPPATSPVLTVPPSPTPTLEPAPLPPETTPECAGYASHLTLAASHTGCIIGDTLVLTATLTNVGACGMLGLPLYTLHFNPDALDPILLPNPPGPVTHYEGINPGESDVITYTLQVVGAGVITLNITASFEVHLGYPGPAYWSRDNSPSLTITVQSAP
jgi:hypothetical protein